MERLVWTPDIQKKLEATVEKPALFFVDGSPIPPELRLVRTDELDAVLREVGRMKLLYRSITPVLSDTRGHLSEARAQWQKDEVLLAAAHAKLSLLTEAGRGCALANSHGCGCPVVVASQESPRTANPVDEVEK